MPQAVGAGHRPVVRESDLLGRLQIGGRIGASIGRRSTDTGARVSMSSAQTIALGAVAGFTIFLGLPMGRMRGASLRLKTFLNGVSAGILVFLFFDILEHSTEVVVSRMELIHEGKGAWGALAGLSLVHVLAFGVGLLSLLYVQRLWRR